MKKLFGTDGIRGHANQEPMTPETVLHIAMGTAEYFLRHVPAAPNRGGHHFTVVIGKDTRLSGYMIENALVSGFVAMGADVILLGPVPTPAVAMLTRSLRADLGLMVSASHNPFEDNGIKFFDSLGFKLDNAAQETIEKIVHEKSWRPVAAHCLGKAKRLDDAGGRYIEFAKSLFPRDMRLDGLKVAVDCANGAAYKLAPRVLWELGAEVVSIADQPDGVNINHKCGATHLNTLRKAVLEHQADIGLALDGDADRLIVVDDQAQVVDGDQIMAAIASSWQNTGRLKGGAVVATHMSNLGLGEYLAGLEIGLLRSDIGDQAVVRMMQEHGCNLGGEQSGHIVFLDNCSTGDGLVAGLEVLALLKRGNIKASALGKTFKPVPQILKNVKAAHERYIAHPEIRKKIESIASSLGEKARLMVRLSGTEPLIRIMAQGHDRRILENAVLEVEALLTSDIAKAGNG